MIKTNIKKFLILFFGQNNFYEIKAKIGFLIQLHNHNPFLNLFYLIIKNRNKSNLGNYIFFNSLPKSGNSGITTSLIKNSNNYHGDISRLEYNKRTSDYGYLYDHKKIIKKYIKMGNIVLNGHYWINRNDIKFLKDNDIKIVVHFRNPCDAIKSLLDYMEKHNSKIMKYWFRSHYINLNYYLTLNYDEREKLVFQKNIKRYFDFIIEWNKAKTILGDNLKFTYYEDLVLNDKKFIQSIFQFFKVNTSKEIIFFKKKFNKGIQGRGFYLYKKYENILENIIKQYDQTEIEFIKQYLNNEKN